MSPPPSPLPTQGGHVGGHVVPCVATLELRADGAVATRFQGRDLLSDFEFTAHAWPRACAIAFEARAFQGPRDPEPVLMRYKGRNCV
ncbi:hypothetical protein JKP88DRAFT_277156 [Tribonema minus]|uniref:Uncharacterized protein n=1 Tax=Tribonema minus TaxID=303371 RepID=A0A836CFX6_9STRA|nr:hypothetical protein JKP88DRAFT_277156 [Tribonema minus]